MNRLFCLNQWVLIGAIGFSVPMQFCMPKQVPAPALPKFEHGHRQVERMLADRLGMGAYLTPNGMRPLSAGDPLYEWAVENFEGVGTDHVNFWDDANLSSTADAQHVPETPFLPCRIRIAPDYTTGVRIGELRKFEELWVDIIFELCNARNDARFGALDLLCIQHKISYHDYVEEMAMLEHGALIETAKVIQSVWLPWAARAKCSSIPGPEFWNTINVNFDEWFSQYKDRLDGYPYKTYGERYTIFSSKGRRALDDTDWAEGTVETLSRLNFEAAGVLSDQEAWPILQEWLTKRERHFVRSAGIIH